MNEIVRLSDGSDILLSFISKTRFIMARRFDAKSTIHPTVAGGNNIDGKCLERLSPLGSLIGQPRGRIVMR